jgi:hypothetical protein
MVSLQRSFEYRGDLGQISISRVNLEFHIPEFSYFTTSENYANFKRQVDGYRKVVLSQRLREEEYYVELPTTLVIGEQLNAQYGFLRYHKIEPLSYSSVDDFAFKLKCVIVDEYSNEIGEIEFDAIYGLKSTPIAGYRNYRQEVNEYTNRYGTLDDVKTNNLEELLRNESGKIFVINKSACDVLREQVNQIANAGTENDFLLSIIEGLVDLSGNQPKRIENVDSFRLAWLQGILNSSEVQNPDDVINLVSEQFDTLFDFPISVPEIETIDIGGTFTVRSDEEISKPDLEFYDLVVEYPRENSTLRIIRYDWDENDNELADNTIAFSFADNQPIILKSIANTILVKVTGFDGSTLWRNQFDPTDPALQALEIEVPRYRPDAIGSTAGVGRSGRIKRLRGRVIQFGHRYDLNELTIVIQAKKEGDEIWRIVGSTITDSSGNFSLDYPYGTYTEAQALVSLMPDSPANLEVNPDDPTNETISDDFIYLLLQDDEIVEPDEAGQDEESDCAAPKKAKRLPDQSDLIESDEYTQDIGGTCLNLSTPNRTLREYSYNAIVRISDPEVANYVLRKNMEKNIVGDAVTYTVTYNLEGGTQKLERGIVDLDNPIRWEDAPDAKSNLSLYQAVTVATGHILYFKSVFKADGYSLGDLVYSLPLAPGQKKQIVVFESSHSLRGAESQTLTQREDLSAVLTNERLIIDQISGGINEDLRGSSSASTAGISAGLGVGVSYGGIGGSLGVAGGYANSESSASQNSSRGISQFFSEKLRQSLMQNAESYRELNASVVTTVTEGQDYGVTSEVVANHNHCHSLTMMYFEVLRHYAIFQELSHVEECVFVPLLMTHFTTENIHKWKDVLAQHLLPIPSSTYLQPNSLVLGGRRHPLLKAFDANERIKTGYTRVDFPKASYKDDPIRFVKGEISVRVHLKRPKSRYDRIKSLPIISKTVTRQEIDPFATAKKGFWDATAGFFTGGLSLIATGAPGTNVEYKDIEEEILVKSAIFDQFMSLDANYQTVPPAKCIRIKTFHPRPISFPISGFTLTGTYSGDEFFEDGILDKKQWTTYAEILNYSNVYDFLEYYFAGRLIAEWDEIFQNDILPEVFDKIVDSIRIEEISWDLSSMSKYTGGDRRVRIRLNGTTTKTREQLPDTIRLFSNNSVIQNLKGGYTTLILENVRISYSTDFFNGHLFNGYVGDDLLDGTDLYIPMNSREKSNPRTEDKYLVETLIEHLNSNLEHYNKVLWYNLDPDRRYMLLDGFNIEVYNVFGHSAGFRSLASVVKNELITITGNSLVFPVADGYKVGQAYILEDAGDDGQQEISLFDHYKPLTPIPPYRLSVPTRGVFMEAVQGACDACEMVKENSSQDWDKFRTDEPTPISPIVTPTPTITEYKPEYKDFAPPMVNIQNAPDAPAPAAGLAQLAELLGQAGIFNDITGLPGTQENAIRTYLSNQENARAFAEMAKGLASQRHNTQNSDDFMRRVEQARDSGAISDEDYQSLTRQHLQQQIDGGESARESAQLERERSRPSLTEAAIDAANRGQSVQAERTDADGTTESVTLGGREAEGSRIDINHPIERIPQPPDSNVCWAAAATMMVNWKNQASSPTEDVLRTAGSNRTPPDEDYYVNMFTADRGLVTSEKGEFIAALGMTSEDPASYGLPQYIDWLRNYGPLWITTDDDAGPGFSAHARILYRIRSEDITVPNNTDFYFIDPADSRTEPSVESFEVFAGHYEQMATDADPDQNLITQIVHFRDRIVPAEIAEGQAAPMDCSNREPVDPDSIVIGGFETDPPVSIFRNWKAGNNVHHINLPTAGGCHGVKCRQRDQILAVVLHETAGYGLDNPSTVPASWQNNIGAHFVVHTDGSIAQHYDAIQCINHANYRNRISVGIEFVNLVWTNETVFTPPNLALDRTPRETIPSWAPVHGSRYIVPPRNQLEALNELLGDLLVHVGVPNVWLSLNHPAGNHLFLMSDWPEVYGCAGSDCDRAGIYSHHNIGSGHTDGAFQALYTWLRRRAHLSSEDAYEAAKTLVTDNMVVQDGRRFVDVSLYLPGVG